MPCNVIRDATCLSRVLNGISPPANLAAKKLDAPIEVGAMSNTKLELRETSSSHATPLDLYLLVDDSIKWNDHGDLSLCPIAQI